MLTLLLSLLVLPVFRPVIVVIGGVMMVVVVDVVVIVSTGGAEDGCGIGCC